MLGKPRRCSSCGRTTLVLGLGNMGLYARCLECGFRELIWVTSEPPARLRRLLSDFEVDPRSLPLCLYKLVREPRGQAPLGSPLWR